MNILIAGGSGLIGKALKALLEDKGHLVKILSRNPQNEDSIHWDPYKGLIDEEAISETEILINLCGAGIADKRWTQSRKKELADSRVLPTEFLFEKRESMPLLRHYLSASGASCYGFDQSKDLYKETDEFGEDFTSQLVKHWEEEAMNFKEDYHCTIFRISFVLANGGGLKKLSSPIKKGIGAVISPGSQAMPWIHIDDLCNMFAVAIDHSRSGLYNAVANNTSNEEITRLIAKKLNKKLSLPKIPKFVIRILFGELADLIVKGVPVSNAKTRAQGFEFQYENLQTALESLEL